jgi:hypothetical protein
MSVIARVYSCTTPNACVLSQGVYCQKAMACQRQHFFLQISVLLLVNTYFIYAGIDILFRIHEMVFLTESIFFIMSLFSRIGDII